MGGLRELLCNGAGSGAADRHEDTQMRTAVEISLYPLDADYVPPIKDFIERLNAYPNLDVVTNAMSTQVAGEHELVFSALEQETQISDMNLIC